MFGRCIASLDDAGINCHNGCRFGKITNYQEHGGAVNISTTPRVEMSYANGSANTIRPTSITYPNGRLVTYRYGTSGGIDEAMSRISPLVESDGSSAVLAGYSFPGLETPVIVNGTQPSMVYAAVASGGIVIFADWHTTVCCDGSQPSKYMKTNHAVN